MFTTGYSAAAETSRPTEQAPVRAPDDQAGDPGAVKTVPEQARQDQQYMAAMKKCDSMKGGEKQRCTDAAQRKYNRM
jgi:hypothetical protein